MNNIPESMFAKFITYMSEYEITNLEAFQLGTDYDENSLNDVNFMK